MPNLATWLAFVATALVLLLIPGPAVLYIVSQSVEHGRRAGLMATLGSSWAWKTLRSGTVMV